jgi:glycosyltransferase involved in cell wall biosynthesis
LVGAGAPLDVLLVSLGSTAGLRVADEQLCEALRCAGARVDIARAPAPAPKRTLMLTDFEWARAARSAARAALRAHGDAPPRSVIYSSTTAALLWPRPGAIRFDACSAANRPGRHGLWQRPLERRRLRAAPLLLPWSRGALAECSVDGTLGDRALCVPVAVEPSGPQAPVRDVAAVTYGANPLKKGLDRVLAAWLALRAHRSADAGAADGELLVAGVGERELRRAGIEVPSRDAGVRLLGALPREEYRALLRRARVFVCGPRREDYGIAQLEALADGCMLVTTPAPGPYPALELARVSDPRLVDEDLARGLAAALLQPLGDYAERSARALAPFTAAGVRRLVAEELLPRLLAESPELRQ